MPKEKRLEHEVFSELAELCISPGYVHAIAYFCFRDNTIKYDDVMSVEDVLQQFSRDRLLRTEISTLVGLACKTRINTELPSPEVVQNYIDRTETLLEELHHSIMPSIAEAFDFEKIGDESLALFKSGAFLREPIFYSGEGAYLFQYRDFSKLKYQKDDDWFIENKKFTIQEAIAVATTTQALQDVKITELMFELVDKASNEWSLLPAFKFTVKEISCASQIEEEIVNQVIKSFISPVNMSDFNSLDDYNPTNAYPIIELSNNEYVLFQNYSLMQALYETPFFWLHEDERYRPTAMENRGKFAETFSADRLKLVFGEHRVFTNISIYTSRKKWAGEIDVLVVFANRAIVLQAKSKKLTIAARKGNDSHLQNDFKKAVQSAYDQAYLCATLLTDRNHKLIDENGDELNIHRDFKEVYPFCVVSEHYPALATQAKQFLQYNTTNCIKAPFVMDIFMLDVMTEMLQSPLHFLSYVNRRTSYGEKIYSTHELTILSYHLKKNLWMDNEYSGMYFEDDLCADLDLAMLTRREDVPGIDTPEGILTKYRGTVYDQIVKDIEILEHAQTIDLGFFLLTLSGKTVEILNSSVPKLIRRSKEDGKNHDLTLSFDEMRTGLTIHCNDDHPSTSMPRLRNHCEQRKYTQKATSWFGICIGAFFPKVKFGVNLEHEWAKEQRMDELVKDLPKIQRGDLIDFSTRTAKQRKTGRNERCPCGSSKKYKNCCLANL
ncbi:NERD domain-containing protein [Pontibacter akesuensis]|uniref:Preprotein translocase subunit SecA (ATPase, RNA helicase) n=1 Tax=Pontibacter akesuensis TaxID=388950 RepID=A0A1I7KR66_9BACT|nr:NERD domain-containing protein [Pontibacter akesuensis]GHA81184.1 prepilin peptidase [Pontibacter akesuensis]SFU99921.1 Preprotein translocase subunit SecA (ATPase, RNA helicase) [Pontibacter akesuensis]